MDRVSELSYAVNGFFVDREPGFPSLELANTLAGQEGVELSSPNWGREAVPNEVCLVDFPDPSELMYL